MLRILALFLPPTLVLAVRPASDTQSEVSAEVLESQEVTPQKVHDLIDEETSLKAKDKLIEIGDYFGKDYDTQLNGAIDIFDGADNKLDDAEMALMLEALRLMDPKPRQADTVNAMDAEDVDRFMKVIQYFAKEEVEVGGSEGGNLLPPAGGDLVDERSEGGEDLSGRSEEGGLVEEEGGDEDPLPEDKVDTTSALLAVHQHDALRASSPYGMTEQRFNIMKTTVAYFDEGKAVLQKPSAEKLVEALGLLDTNKDGNFDDNELVDADAVIRYFAGDDKKLTLTELGEFEQMKRAVNLYQSTSALKGALAFFDTSKASTIAITASKPKTFLDPEELEGFMAVSTYFAAKGKPPTDASSESSARVDVQAMEGVIRIFIGQKDRLEKTMITQLKEGLQLFDINGNEEMDASELANFKRVLDFFAGPDNLLSSAEFDQMKGAVEKFAPSGAAPDHTRLDGESTAQLLDTLKLFAASGTTLEPRESTELLKVIKHFSDGGKARIKFDEMESAIGVFFGANAKVNPQMVDKFIQVSDYFIKADQNFEKMKTAIGIFQGVDNTINEMECKRLLFALSLVDYEGHGSLKDTELASLLSLLHYFAGSDKEMTDTEFADMKLAVSTVKDTYQGNAPSHKRMEQLLTMLGYFDVDALDTPEYKGKLDSDELCSFMVVLRSYYFKNSGMLQMVRRRYYHDKEFTQKVDKRLDRASMHNLVAERRVGLDPREDRHCVAKSSGGQPDKSSSVPDEQPPVGQQHEGAGEETRGQQREGDRPVDEPEGEGAETLGQRNEGERPLEEQE